MDLETDRENLKRYFRGLELANKADLEERRRMSIEERIHQASLVFGIMTKEGAARRDKEETEVREIWARLLRVWRSQHKKAASQV